MSNVLTRLIILWAKLYKTISDQLNRGHARNVLLKRNIVLSVGLKSINVVVQLVTIPLLLGYLGPIRFGIWITIWAAANWINFFDVGLGNGLRNKLAEALAVNDGHVAKMYVSTTYAVVTVITLASYLIFAGISKTLSWQNIFNAPPSLASEINVAIFLVFTSTSINFIVKLISNILYANQMPFVNDLISASSSALSLLAFYLLRSPTNNPLVLVGGVFGVSLFLPPTIASVALFSTIYRSIKPEIKYINIDYITSISTIGMKFFIMQIGAVVMLTSDNMIISQLFGPESVASYAIPLRYFNVYQMGFLVLLVPIYSAHTQAYALKDFRWIGDTIGRLVKIWKFGMILVLFMLLASGTFYKYWVGGGIKIPFLLSFYMAVFVCLSTWNNIFATFLMAVGKVRLLFYLSIIIIFIHIPLVIYFAKYLQFGVEGVMMATILSLIAGAIIQPIQSFKIINNSATGVWNE